MRGMGYMKRKMKRQARRKVSKDNPLYNPANSKPKTKRQIPQFLTEPPTLKQNLLVAGMVIVGIAVFFYGVF